ncbi:MAG: hypothetical protein J6S97_02865 [Bacteroidales bacterium]|nr:hypothetical protein [Bacteroidales bacterium]
MRRFVLILATIFCSLALMAQGVELQEDNIDESAAATTNTTPKTRC